MDFRVGVVTVIRGRHATLGRAAGLYSVERITVSIAVEVSEKGRHRRPVVHEIVTIVVETVTELGSAGIGLSHGVVAIVPVLGMTLGQRAGSRRGSWIAEPVAIAVGPERNQELFVDLFVAVVVPAVTDLDPHGTDVGVQVVAVASTLDVAFRQRARLDGSRFIAVGVRIEIRKVGGGHAVIDDTVAVFVHLVALLHGVGIDLRVVIVTVEVVVDVPLGREAADGFIEGVTVSVFVVIAEEAHHIDRVLVDLSIAVVVPVVADFVGVGKGLGTHVVAIALGAGQSVFVEVVDPVCDGADELGIHVLDRRSEIIVKRSQLLFDEITSALLERKDEERSGFARRDFYGESDVESVSIEHLMVRRSPTIEAPENVGQRRCAAAIGVVGSEPSICEVEQSISARGRPEERVVVRAEVAPVPHIDDCFSLSMIRYRIHVASVVALDFVIDIDGSRDIQRPVAERLEGDEPPLLDTRGGGFVHLSVDLEVVGAIVRVRRPVREVAETIVIDVE